MIALSILAVGLVAVLETLCRQSPPHRQGLPPHSGGHSCPECDGRVFLPRIFLEDGEDSGDLPDGFFLAGTGAGKFSRMKPKKRPRKGKNDTLGGESSLLHIKEITVSVGWEEGEQPTAVSSYVPCASCTKSPTASKRGKDKRATHSRGFTLLELLISLMLIQPWSAWVSMARSALGQNALETRQPPGVLRNQRVRAGPGP